MNEKKDEDRPLVGVSALFFLEYLDIFGWETKKREKAEEEKQPGNN